MCVFVYACVYVCVDACAPGHTSPFFSTSMSVSLCIFISIIKHLIQVLEGLMPQWAPYNGSSTPFLSLREVFASFLVFVSCCFSPNLLCLRSSRPKYNSSTINYWLGAAAVFSFLFCFHSTLRAKHTHTHARTSVCLVFGVSARV